MYIEQVVEVSGNKSTTILEQHQQQQQQQEQLPTDSGINRGILDSGGYALARKLLPAVNHCPALRENMDRGEKKSSSVELSSELLENIVENVEDNNEGEEEEEDGNPKTELLDDSERVVQDDDNLDEDNDEEGSSFLFGNKIQSIFIRRRTIDCEAEESIEKATELRHPDNWIAKKVGKRTRKLKKKHALSFLDTLLSLFVVAPLVIGQWRGIWGMMDIYNDHFPEWICFIVGIGLHVVFAIVRDQLHGRVVEKWRTSNWVGRVAYDFIRLVYIYVFCAACNAHWRGGWIIFSEYFGSNILVVSLFTTFFATALLILRAFRNLLAPPFIVVIDEPERVFKFPTRYNVTRNVDDNKPQRMRRR